MKALIAALPLAATLSACGGGAPAPAQVEVADALCRPVPAGRDVTGCYVTLTASRDDRLTGLSTPAAREGQIHAMKMEDGLMTMSRLPDGVALPAGETVRLAPGGNHLMLFGLNRALAQGESLDVILTFAHAPARTVRFAVGQPAPSGGHGDHMG